MAHDSSFTHVHGMDFLGMLISSILLINILFLLTRKITKLNLNSVKEAAHDI